MQVYKESRNSEGSKKRQVKKETSELQKHIDDFY